MNQHWRNQNWTSGRLILLIKLWQEDISLEDIAAQMHEGCTPDSVRNRAAKMGLGPRPYSTQPWELWPKPHCDLLAELWSAGTSGVNIALLLNQRFKTSYTRSAVIGKAHRMKLPGHLSLRISNGRANKMTNAQLRKMPAAPHRAPLAAIHPLPPIKPTPEPDRAQWVKWEALEPGQCRNIWGDPQGEFGYCGKPAIPSQSWCPGCKARVYIQIDTRQRKKDWSDETKMKIAELQRIIAD